jgi:integrase
VGCGTRISETLHIEKRDLDLARGTLLLRFTKNDKERIIPVASSIITRSRDYLDRAWQSRGFHGSPFLFPNKEGNAYSNETAYKLFRGALHSAGISHGGRGKGPRLHDLRHTYAVRILNKWVRDGRNLTTALPYLAAYMGHSGLKASERYLRLTVTMFPDLIKAAEASYGWVIPEAHHG